MARVVHRLVRAGHRLLASGRISADTPRGVGQRQRRQRPPVDRRILALPVDMGRARRGGFLRVPRHLLADGDEAGLMRSRCRWTQ